MSSHGHISSSLRRQLVSSWLNICASGLHHSVTVTTQWHRSRKRKKSRANKGVAWLAGLLRRWRNSDTEINATLYVEYKVKV